jgi:hypothetical protein
VTFGYAVGDSQAWPAIVARSLPGAQVINLGLIGAGPQQYARVYETFGTRLHPKLLLVGFFAQNDFWDADMFDIWKNFGIGANYLVWRDFGMPTWVDFSLRHPLAKLESVLRSRAYPLIRKSELYNLLLTLRGGEGGLSEAPRILSFADGRRLQLLPDAFSDTVHMAQPDRREFRLAVEALQGIQSIAGQNGTHTLIVLLPGKEEVYLPLLGQAVASLTDALRQTLEKDRIDWLDLAPSFRQRAAVGERLFYEADGHPNPAGYALIAGLVTSHLRQHRREYGLPESPPAP